MIFKALIDMNDDFTETVNKVCTYQGFYVVDF